jgi:hypothetical protein
MNSWQVAPAGGGFRIIVIFPESRQPTLGGVFTVADANKWTADHQGAFGEAFSEPVGRAFRSPGHSVIPRVVPEIKRV